MIHRLLTSKLRRCVKCGSRRHKRFLRLKSRSPQTRQTKGKGKPGNKLECVECPR